MGEDRSERAREQALHATGLTARPDSGMDRFARLVASALRVPVALVSLVERDRQVFPGLLGLGEPLASTRATPLSHSLCQTVVRTGSPLVLHDTEADQNWCSHPAVTDLKVAAYAGMPLTDDDGNVLGSLCAIDTSPREWTGEQLQDLVDLAAACSAELRLLIASRRLEAAHARASALSERTRLALNRAELLLRAANDLADTTGLGQVRRQVRDLITGDMLPRYVGLVLVEGKRLRRLIDEDDVDAHASAMEHSYENYGLDDAWPTARAARDNTTVIIQGAADLVAGGYSRDAVDAWAMLDLHTAICVPLPGAFGPLGTLVIGWDAPHRLDALEQAIVTALAGYTARAIERAVFVDHRIVVARQLQQAMLTDLPVVRDLEVAALYRPAATGELVGGDWYDAYPLPRTADDSATLAVTIGDITGHDIRASTKMGQIRSMLRQADLDHPGAGPAHVLAALEHANLALGVNASGTLVHAHLRPAQAGHWELSWTNAGHPHPLLRHPDGRVEDAGGHDMMFFPGMAPRQRTTHRLTLAPGSCVLLHTDGLVERPGRDTVLGTAQAAALLAEHGHRCLPDLLELLADEVGGARPGDDIALLVLRVP
ncbi:GAF domain-containing SpoIIE family protein phosphatase [Lentzea sp. NPDC060358]|uniref:GAF domain-containing SpoIIE family protein phosphatase n=1 Tax=Lentzea sp. NPDC060358 TaxID=3347103 RepID=UPI0036535CEE